MSFNVEAVVDELENANSKIEGLQYDLDEAQAYIKILETGVGRLTGTKTGTTNYDSIMRHMTVERLAELLVCRNEITRFVIDWGEIIEPKVNAKIQYLNRDYKQELDDYCEQEDAAD